MNGSICLIPFIIMVIIAIPIWTRNRSKALINDWAIDQGLQIIHAQQRLFQRGPFDDYNENTAIWFITLQNYQGIQQQGWILCVLPLLGETETRVEYRPVIN